MEAENQQKKRAAVMKGTNTPKKPSQKPKRSVIGSSSTWKEEQLDLFKVKLKDVDARGTMIPEKWFDFSGLEKYQQSNNPMGLFCWLTVARDFLLSIQRDDFMNNRLLQQKAVASPFLSYSFVHLRNLLTLKTTDSRKGYLAAKRREKRASKENTQNTEVEDEDEGGDETLPVDNMPPPVSRTRAHQVGPKTSQPEFQQDDEESQRVPSIADPEIPSAGSKLYHACREITTQSLANHFLNSVLMTLFDDDASLSWVTGRTQKPVLRWREEFVCFTRFG
jgi:hypothetical protein